MEDAVETQSSFVGERAERLAVLRLQDLGLNPATPRSAADIGVDVLVTAGSVEFGIEVKAGTSAAPSGAALRSYSQGRIGALTHPIGLLFVDALSGHISFGWIVEPIASGQLRRTPCLELRPASDEVMTTAIDEAIAWGYADRNGNASDARHRQMIHRQLDAIAKEVLEHITESGPTCEEGWVAAADIKNRLGLNLDATPLEGVQHGTKGWLFAILARMLEDRGLVEYKKVGGRAFYRLRG